MAKYTTKELLKMMKKANGLGYECLNKFDCFAEFKSRSGAKYHLENVNCTDLMRD